MANQVDLGDFGQGGRRLGQAFGRQQHAGLARHIASGQPMAAPARMAHFK